MALSASTITTGSDAGSVDYAIQLTAAQITGASVAAGDLMLMAINVSRVNSSNEGKVHPPAGWRVAARTNWKDNATVTKRDTHLFYRMADAADAAGSNTYNFDAIVGIGNSTSTWQATRVTGITTGTFAKVVQSSLAYEASGWTAPSSPAALAPTLTPGEHVTVWVNALDDDMVDITEWTIDGNALHSVYSESISGTDSSIVTVIQQYDDTAPTKSSGLTPTLTWLGATIEFYAADPDRLPHMVWGDTANATATTTITPATPASGVAAGDLAVAIAAASDEVTWTLPTGWTLLDSDGAFNLGTWTPTDPNFSVVVAYKELAGSDDFGFDTSGSADLTVALVILRDHPQPPTVDTAIVGYDYSANMPAATALTAADAGLWLALVPNAQSVDTEVDGSDGWTDYWSDNADDTPTYDLEAIAVLGPAGNTYTITAHGDDTANQDNGLVVVLGFATPAVPPDRDAGVWVEAWDLPNTTRRIATLPVLTDGVDIQQYRQPPGDGAISIPSDYGRLDEVFNPLGTVTPVVATGGTKTTPGDGYVYHELANGQSLVVTTPGVVDMLLVAGGGGGGGRGYDNLASGGGGGGEVRKVLNTYLAPGTYPAVVGAGGVGGAVYGAANEPGGYAGTKGGDTTFAGFSAEGGGGGAGDNEGPIPDTQEATAGGSGGGGSAASTATGAVGNAGGAGGDAGSVEAGGGGGAGGPGVDGDDATTGSQGGPGILVPEFDQFGASGGYFGGGGGGGISGISNEAAAGGIGGGGGGTSPTAGVAKTGGGGAGRRQFAFDNAKSGTSGGSGTVLVRYPETVTTPTRSLLKVYVDGLFRYGFFPERINRPLGEEQPVAKLAGRGQESQASWAYLPPPAWNYGYDTNYFQNFTEPPDLLDNGGFYEPLEGAFGDPTPGWGSYGGASHTPCTGCTTGTYGNVIKVTPGGVHKGISQSVGESDGLLPGGRYKLRTWIEGSVTGQRITISMDFGDASNSPTIHTTNGYTYKGDVYAELENVARNPAANGAPGGSTDGTVQYTELDVTIPSDCESMTVRILSDHHAVAGAPGNQEFWVHGAALEGVGAGMPDEYAWGGSPTQFDTGAATPISGDYSWRWTPESTAARISLVGPITVEPGDYFARYVVRVPSFAAQVRLIVYGGDATTIFSDTGWIGSIDPGFPEYIDVAFTRSAASDQIYLGVGVQGVTTTYTFDELGVFSGRPPSSPGQIIGDMLAAVQALGFLTWLQTDFTAITDSNGELWRSASIAADFGYGGTLKAALDRLATMGYEWIIEAENQRLGYDTGWVLRLFNGYQAP